jgi:ORF6N domain
MLDEDLADLYGVETRTLVQQVKRNTKRFPEDFMFQLSAEEFNDLKSQSVMSSGQHGGRRTRPLVFTEQGVAMLSGVLRSERAIAVNIEIMRAFVELRRAASSYAAIEKRLEELERETGAKLGQLRTVSSASSPTSRKRRSQSAGSRTGR